MHNCKCVDSKSTKLPRNDCALEEPSTLQCHKAAITCTRITGHHTYDVFAAKIENVHENFGLSGKVSATVTDNGSNFVKAFATFALPDVSST